MSEREQLDAEVNEATRLFAERAAKCLIGRPGNLEQGIPERYENGRKKDGLAQLLRPLAPLEKQTAGRSAEQHRADRGGEGVSGVFEHLAEREKNRVLVA